ncbi:hypothetical protein D9V32_15560 [Mycetocola tolaasinivorans]|uniref:Uncharacterized protein n=1 Tax=Mycetocola tolaasinivorans TaxID=76635 RepID=A0A3L6ZWP8_9MICO|nr:hypothetical protein D9V32_15560 [Mycetocola tolaasinivorans]
MIAPWPDLDPWEETTADREMQLYLQSLDPDVVEAERHVRLTPVEQRILDAKTQTVPKSSGGLFHTQNAPTGADRSL